MEIKYALKDKPARRNLTLSDLRNGDIFRLVDDKPNIVRVMVCETDQRCLTLNKQYINDGCYTSQYAASVPVILMKGSFVVTEMVTETDL
jgi:hypothetical protein